MLRQGLELSIATAVVPQGSSEEAQLVGVHRLTARHTDLQWGAQSQVPNRKVLDLGDTPCLTQLV